MANHKSAIKRMRQSTARRARNVHFKTFMKTNIRQVREAIEAGEPTAAQAALKKAMATIDRVASKGIIHRNTASRRISRLSKAVHRMTIRNEASSQTS